MPRKRRIDYQIDLVSRIRVRRAIGRLSHTLVQPRTYRRYSQMVQSFVSWVRAHGIDVASDLEQLDFQLCEWIEALWAHGRPAGDAGATLSGVQFFLRRKRVLHSAWNLLKAWQRTEMPQRAPPMPEYVLMSLATVARSWSRNDVAVLLVIGYSVFLRTMELLTLRKWQLQFSNDGLSLVIALPVTKAGKRRHCEESVTLHDARIVHFVRVLTQHLPPDAPLLQGTVPEFRDVFKALLKSLNLERQGYQIYSLRRGGATTHYRRFENMGLTLVTGRWQDTAVARIYISDGVQTLLQNDFLPVELERFRVLAGALNFDVG